MTHEVGLSLPETCFEHEVGQGIRSTIQTSIVTPSPPLVTSPSHLRTPEPGIESGISQFPGALAQQE